MLFFDKGRLDILESRLDKKPKLKNRYKLFKISIYLA
jgi:hypothetical protein